MLKIFLFGLLFSAKAMAGYAEPPNACAGTCTPWMRELLSDFENKGTLVENSPAVYSGDCHHLSDSYNPDTTHYAVVMVDQLPTSADFYFSTIFSFFAPENEFAKWDLKTSRENMSDYWQTHGQMLRSEKTTRVEIPYDDGRIAYTYYMRQNPQTKEIYYITYGGISLISFCRLEKN